MMQNILFQPVHDGIITSKYMQCIRWDAIFNFMNIVHMSTKNVILLLFVINKWRADFLAVHLVKLMHLGSW